MLVKVFEFTKKRQMNQIYPFGTDENQVLISWWNADIMAHSQHMVSRFS
jgi:hypothetical protein